MSDVLVSVSPAKERSDLPCRNLKTSAISAITKTMWMNQPSQWRKTPTIQTASKTIITASSRRSASFTRLS